MIKLQNIEKSYRHGLSQTFVLRRVNAEIKQGDFVSIMGPSGAGKSTLLHILGMHDSAWTGEYWLLDDPIHQLSAKDRMRLQKQHIGFVFQSYHLLDNLTVYENIDLPLSYRDVKKAEREGMVADILDRFNIVGKKDLFPNQLSGGQQQLVAIARAVVAKPTLILADEPTGNLHSDQGKEIMELFRRLNEAGTTIVQVTHSKENAVVRPARDQAEGRLDRLMRTKLTRAPAADPARRRSGRRPRSAAAAAEAGGLHHRHRGLAAAAAARARAEGLRRGPDGPQLRARHDLRRRRPRSAASAFTPPTNRCRSSC